MASDPAGSPSAGWVQVRDRVGVRTFFRMALGFTAVLVIVLAGLALLNSFFVDLAPGQPDPDPGGGEEQEEGDEGGGGDGPECTDFERGFQWTFILFTVAAVVLFAVAIARREHSANRIGTSLWGILSIVAAFLAVLTFGAWRVMKAICDDALTCGSANDGTYTAFLFLLVLTLVAMAAGIVFSHVQRRNFLGTGWGLLGLLMYLPTILTGFAWFTIRTFCTPDLSCALRDDFLSGLATVFWIGLGGAVIATGVGIFVQKRFDHGFFKSGWGVVVIALGLLAVLAGTGWLYVDSLTIPGCDEFELEEPEEPQTCEEMRDDLQGRIGTGMLVVLGLVVVLGGVGAVLHRENLRSVFTSVWGILVYVGLGLLLIMAIGYMLVGTMCDEGEDGDGGGEDDGSGDGDGDGSGGDGGGDGGGSGGGGGGGGSGGGSGGGDGSQTGGGGGGGGVGDANPVQAPINIDPSAFTWLLVALLVVAGVVALIVLLRFRTGGKEGKGGPTLASQTLKARERKDMMQMLAQGKFAGADEVIAAYRAFVDWAEQRGMGVRPDETPREHGRRVAQEFEASEGDVDGFVQAYEVARLSQHDPSDDQREMAVRFAKALRARKEVGPE